MIQCFLIDDDEDDREFFAMALDSMEEKIQLVTANNGAEALALLQSDSKLNPDIIFIDVNMPKMNGIECLQGMGVIERVRHSRKIMYSTTSEPRVVVECRRLGADDFMVKPESFALLKQQVADIFNIQMTKRI